MRIKALIIRIIRQFVRDKRSMALLIAAPLLVLTLMYLVFNGDTYVPKIGLLQNNEQAAQVFQKLTEPLQKSDAELSYYTDEAEAHAALREQKLDALLKLENDGPVLLLEGSDPSKNKAVMLTMQAAMHQALQLNLDMTSQSPFKTEYLHGSKDMSSFDHFGPVLIGVFSFFFVFLIAGISFLKERTSGTLERLLATPLRRWELVCGYIAGFGIFTSIQAVLIAWFSIQVLGLLMTGSIFYVLLITFLLSITALSLGTFLSAFAKTEFQMIQFIPIVIVPQIFFSGLFNLETMHPALRWLSYLMPLRYGADALRDVMIRGEGWSSIAGSISLLLGLSILFITANIVALRKHRKI